MKNLAFLLRVGEEAALVAPPNVSVPEKHGSCFGGVYLF